MAILSSRQTYRNPSTSHPTPQTLNPKMNPTSTASEKQVHQQHLDIKHNPHHRNQRNDAEDALIPACMDAEGSQLGQYGPIASFDDMGLPTAILRGIYACGYEDPSVIQQLVKTHPVPPHFVSRRPQSPPCSDTHPRHPPPWLGTNQNV